MVNSTCTTDDAFFDEAERSFRKIEQKQERARRECANAWTVIGSKNVRLARKEERGRGTDAT
jgi:hypothetical protein